MPEKATKDSTRTDVAIGDYIFDMATSVRARFLEQDRGPYAKI